MTAIEDMSTEEIEEYLEGGKDPQWYKQRHGEDGWSKWSPRSAPLSSRKTVKTNGYEYRFDLGYICRAKIE